MEKRIEDLYWLPNIELYSDTNLLSLRETCATLEEQVYEIIDRLSEHDGEILKAYIYARDDLEFESVKTALRWGKLHYKSIDPSKNRCEK